MAQLNMDASQEYQQTKPSMITNKHEQSTIRKINNSRGGVFANTSQPSLAESGNQKRCNSSPRTNIRKAQQIRSFVEGI